jgi:hypothetical protein
VVPPGVGRPLKILLDENMAEPLVGTLEKSTTADCGDQKYQSFTLSSRRHATVPRELRGEAARWGNCA